MRTLRLLGIILILAACRGSPPATTQPAALQASHTTSASIQEQPSTQAPIPSATLFPTPIPEIDYGPEIIGPANAGQVMALAELGKGTILSHPFYAPEGQPIYSPDGLLMAIPTSAGIYIYSAATLEELHKIPAATHFITFSPDSSLLASSGVGEVTFWNPATGTRMGELKGDPESWYWEVVFSPDGRLLSAVSIHNEVSVWSLEDDDKLFSFPGDRLRFSPDGELAVVVVYGENRVHLYEMRRGSDVNEWNVNNAGFAPGGQLWLEDDEGVRLVYIDRDQVTAPFEGVQPSFSKDGTLMALFAHEQVSLYDHQKGRRTQMLEGSYISIDGVVFSPNGETLAGDVYTLLCPTCTEMDGLERFLVLWRAADGSIITRIKHPSGWIAYSPDGSSLAALEMESMQIVNTGDGSIAKQIDGFTNPVEGMALSPEGKTLAAVHTTAEYTLRLWDLESGSAKRTFQARENFSESNFQVSFSREGDLIAVGGDLWDFSTGERLTRLEQSISEKTSCRSANVAFSPTEDTLATGCFEGQLDLWSIPDGTLLKSIGGYKSWVNELAYSPEGKHLAAVYNVPDYLVQVWKLPEGTPEFTLAGGHFTRVTYSTDGSLLATVMANPEYDQYGWQAGFVQLWSAADGKERLKLEIDDAVSIAFSPDDKVLATGSFDGTLRLWDVGSGHLLLETKVHYAQIQRLIFTPDGTSLVSGSMDGRVLAWGVPENP